MSTTVQEHTISRDLLPPRLAVLGHIKIGGKKPQAVTSQKGNEFQPPVKYDHFKVTTRTRGSDGNFELDTAVHEVVGEKPTELDVRLPFDTRGENFYAKMVHYKGRTRELECDGETQTKVQTQESGACPRTLGRSCPCKPYGRLAVILEAAPTFGGLYVYRTTSWESVNSLQTALKMFEEQFGSLRGLPLKLRLYPAEVRYQQNGQERTATAYKVALVLRASYDEARTAAVEYHRRNQIAKKEILQLAAGVAGELADLDAQDEGHIGDEYFPPTNGSPEPSGSALARMNREIVHGVPEDESQEDEEPDEPSPEVLRMLARVTELRGTPGLELTDGQRARLDEAVQARDTDNLTQSIDWLEEKVAELPPTADELKRLADLRQKARGIGDGLNLDDEGELDEVQRLKDGRSVREWIRKLEDITDGGQGDLLDGED